MFRWYGGNKEMISEIETNIVIEQVDDVVSITEEVTQNTVIEGNPVILQFVSSAPSRFIYSQDAASNSWVINHNLEVYPEVKVLDTANTEIVGDVIYLSLNSIRIDFSAPFSGKAYLI